MSVSEQPTVAVIAPAGVQRAQSGPRPAAGHVRRARDGQSRTCRARPANRSRRARCLRSGKPGVCAVLEGGLGKPHVRAPSAPQSGTAKQLRLFIAEARRSAGNDEREAVPCRSCRPALRSRRRTSAPGLTAHARTVLLFLLTLLLAGMLLSQLIEEKSNKVIEVLAAAVPVDAIFLGKLLAMLAASLVGHRGLVVRRRRRDRRLCARGLETMPPPAVGWPAFILLASSISR